MNKFNMKTILLVLMMFVVVFGMGIFKTQIYGDRTFHKFALQQGTNDTYVVDIGEMGIVKYMVQPNIMTVYMRIEAPTDVKALRCEVEGIENIATQGSKKGVWKKLTSSDILKKGRWGDAIPLTLEIAVPREDVYKYDVGVGKVTFTNEGAPYAVLNVKIINSKYVKI